ncbi:hypothetical protein [Nocardioides convexus]|nr:hypothetical protein [Nocardioides convexus]
MTTAPARWSARLARRVLRPQGSRRRRGRACPDSSRWRCASTSTA